MYRLLRGQIYEKSKSRKKFSQTPKKEVRALMIGVGPRFRSIWAQNLDFWLFLPISSKESVTVVLKYSKIAKKRDFEARLLENEVPHRSLQSILLF